MANAQNEVPLTCPRCGLQCVYTLAEVDSLWFEELDYQRLCPHSKKETPSTAHTCPDLWAERDRIKRELSGKT